jgi:hypothetical protein
MLTSSVDVVQSSFPEVDHGEISGLSRSVIGLIAAILLPATETPMPQRT